MEGESYGQIGNVKGRVIEEMERSPNEGVHLGTYREERDVNVGFTLNVAWSVIPKNIKILIK